MVIQTQVKLLIHLFTCISVLTFQGDGDSESKPLRKKGLYHLTKFYEMERKCS